MVKSLYQFQIKGVEYAVRHHGRVLIGDEMGVGKTVQALAVSYIYRHEWPLLILAPSSLKLVWRDEIRKWLPGIPLSQIEVIRTSKDAFAKQSQVYIMSYDLAKNVQHVLESKTFHIAIADEGVEAGADALQESDHAVGHSDVGLSSGSVQHRSHLKTRPLPAFHRVRETILRPQAGPLRNRLERL